MRDPEKLTKAQLEMIEFTKNWIERKNETDFARLEDFLGSALDALREDDGEVQ